MGQLRASVDGCEVVVKFEEGTEFSPALVAALSEVAEAMHAEAVGGAEVQGFGLTVGSLGLDLRGPAPRGAGSCWGYTGTDDGGSCTWYTDSPSDPNPQSCTIYSTKPESVR